MPEPVRLRPRRRKRGVAPAGPGEVVPFRKRQPRVAQIDVRPGYAALARLEALLDQREGAG